MPNLLTKQKIFEIIWKKQRIYITEKLLVRNTSDIYCPFDGTELKEERAIHLITILYLFSRYTIFRKIKSATGKAISSLLIKDWFDTIVITKSLLADNGPQ